ncbi:MAG: prolipoprotein diacylglyceryl transferase family protein [bacterium]
MLHWYGLIVGVAIVVGWSVAEKLESKVGGIAPWAIGVGLVGARVYHVVDYWGYYSQNLGQIVAVWRGGLSIWGGLIGGLVVVGIWYFELNKDRREFGKILGAIVTGMPIGQAIGRLANAVNGEFTQQVWILPWWASEAILDLVLFGILWSLRGLSSQARVGVYLVGYGLIRWILNPFRI